MSARSISLVSSASRLQPSKRRQAESWGDKRKAIANQVQVDGVTGGYVTDAAAERMCYNGGTDSARHARKVDQVNDKQKMTRSEAGRLGGKATAARHDREHFADIGRKGGATTLERGLWHFVEIGAKGGRATMADRGSAWYKRIGSKKAQDPASQEAKKREN